MTRWLERNGYTIAVVVLLFGIVAVGSFLVVTAGPDIAKAAFGSAAPTPAAGAPSPTPGSAMAISPIGITMPVGSDCNGCHVTDGTIGTKPIPTMGHPLFGWRDCTACHTSGSLVKSAPGHSSLHKDDCLVCHQTRTEAGADSPAPLRPEHMGTDKPCAACHGVDEHAPLPDSMVGRENCWVCHNGTEFTYLFEEGASAEPGPSDGASGTEGLTDAAEVAYRLEGDTLR